MITCVVHYVVDPSKIEAFERFSFPSLADYKTYRARFGRDPEFVEADRIRDESGCVLRYDRTFMRPPLP